jgi:ribosomal protein S6E (S10)
MSIFKGIRDRINNRRESVHLDRWRNDQKYFERWTKKMVQDDGRLYRDREFAICRQWLTENVESKELAAQHAKLGSAEKGDWINERRAQITVAGGTDIAGDPPDRGLHTGRSWRGDVADRVKAWNTERHLRRDFGGIHAEKAIAYWRQFKQPEERAQSAGGKRAALNTEIDAAIKSHAAARRQRTGRSHLNITGGTDNTANDARKEQATQERPIRY